MKKYFKLLIMLLGVMFISTTVLAEEVGKPYEYFDFKVERVDGTNIKSTNIIIYASVEGDEANLIDRTSEFNLVEVMWSACVDVDCATSEEVSDNAVFETGKDYVLMVRVSAKNGASINVWGTDKAKYNGTPIELLAGEFGNTGNELMIKTRTNVNTSATPESTKVEDPAPAPTQEITTVGTTEGNACMFNMELCCTESLGISICVWILIVVGLLLLVIISKLFKGKKKDDKPASPAEGVAFGESRIINDDTSILNIDSPVVEMPKEAPIPQAANNVQSVEETPNVVPVTSNESSQIDAFQNTNYVSNLNNGSNINNVNDTTNTDNSNNML